VADAAAIAAVAILLKKSSDVSPSSCIPGGMACRDAIAAEAVSGPLAGAARATGATGTEALSEDVSNAFTALPKAGTAMLGIEGVPHKGMSALSEAGGSAAIFGVA
jgi:hypothetical protein